MSWGKKDKEITDSTTNFDEVKKIPDTEEFELENDEAGTATLADKLKKLRTELDKCKGEGQEYLDGWQRCKADSINARKEALSMAERAGNRARDALIEDVIPALDSFDMAIGSVSWPDMDTNWRMGMENVRSQLIAALSNQGVSSFTETGDIFEPTLHEAVQEVDEEGKPGSIVKVLRRGYRAGDKIIRPAQVAIIAHRHKSIT